MPTPGGAHRTMFPKVIRKIRVFNVIKSYKNVTFLLPRVLQLW
jgi:hypothetical protein